MRIRRWLSSAKKVCLAADRRPVEVIALMVGCRSHVEVMLITSFV